MYKVPITLMQVFRRGLQAIPLSVDLWIHYLNYVRATRESEPEYVRQQFEEALRTVGLEFRYASTLFILALGMGHFMTTLLLLLCCRSDKLWEHYINYEKDCGNIRNLLTIYDQLLATPTQSYLQHYNK